MVLDGLIKDRILIYSEERKGYYYQLADELSPEVAIIRVKKPYRDSNAFANMETDKEYLSIANGKTSGSLGFVEASNIKDISLS